MRNRYTISHAGLVSGRKWPRPGEISLAHRGVLFLDELPEFGSHNLETLRQPLEDRIVTISRTSGSLTFPGNLVLVAALNPCLYGFLGAIARSLPLWLLTIELYGTDVLLADIPDKLSERYRACHR